MGQLIYRMSSEASQYRKVWGSSWALLCNGIMQILNSALGPFGRFKMPVGQPLNLCKAESFGARHQVLLLPELPDLAFSRPKNKFGFSRPKNKFGLFKKLLVLEIFDNLLSNWPYFMSIIVSIVKSKMLPFLKQRLAFVSYKHLATLGLLLSICSSVHGPPNSENPRAARRRKLGEPHCTGMWPWVPRKHTHLCTHAQTHTRMGRSEPVLEWATPLYVSACVRTEEDWGGGFIMAAMRCMNCLESCTFAEFRAWKSS